MLRLERATGKFSDGNFRDLPELLHPGDLLVFNNSRVFPARLYGRRQGPETVRNTLATRDNRPGRIEVLLTRQLSTEPNDWECLVRPGRKIGVGERLLFSRTNSDRVELEAEVLSRAAFGQREIRFAPVADFFATLDRVGHIPLPPYIARPGSAADPEINDQERTDRERYQTIYANPRGSVAAPTAGLHFTSEILQRIRERGIETAEITLHVGLGTFQPIRVERVEAHRIHVEPYSISISAASALNQALKDSGRIVAIGTTTVRTLEHAIRAGGGQILEGAASADIFIYPGFEFRAVQAMLTNFHLPQSSLLMLVSAFAGRENVLRAYQHAVAERYRFYSYGDCMFIE